MKDQKTKIGKARFLSLTSFTRPAVTSLLEILFAAYFLFKVGAMITGLDYFRLLLVVAIIGLFALRLAYMIARRDKARQQELDKIKDEYRFLFDNIVKNIADRTAADKP